MNNLGFHLPLLAVDPAIARLLEREVNRQTEGLELIASENFVSAAVLEAMGTVFTNKYAEGYPGKRYYGGCSVVDEVEQLAIDRAKQLFGAEHANVQPHSGSQANAAALAAFLAPGDCLLGMDLNSGGHLTHGFKVNFSGKLYRAVTYGVDAQGFLDYDDVHRKAVEHKPKVIIAGYSAHSRILDFGAFRSIADEVGAILIVDMAHFAGLVAGGVHPSPVPIADVVTTTTHKTLRGPRAGLILCKEVHAKAIDSAVFPGQQGGPLMHMIAAKAVCLNEALDPGFRNYAAQVVMNAKTLASELIGHGFQIISGGTDNHLMLVDLRPYGITGKAAQAALERAGITVNKNGIPNDPEKPMVTSGIRIGTPAVTTRGMKEGEMRTIAGFIATVLAKPESEDVAREVMAQVGDLTRGFPMYG